MAVILQYVLQRPDWRLTFSLNDSIPPMYIEARLEAYFLLK
jgi:hypothetical protein